MRDREEIEREIEQRRDDLAENIAQLKDAVLGKVQPFLFTGIAAGALLAAGLIIRRARRVRHDRHHRRLRR